MFDIEQQLGKQKSTPPVEKWNPPLCGDMPLIIKKNGQWLHDGQPFSRKRMVNLFASVLKKEDEHYYLVTPVEKWRIVVEDRPLQVVLLGQKDGFVHCTTATGDEFVIDDAHPIKLSELDGEQIAEVLVRRNLWARFSRNAFYELSELLEINENNQCFLKSGDVSYELGQL